MGDGLPFQFSLLVVEDEPEWQSDLKRALQRELQGSKLFSWDLVSNSHDARNQLGKKHYHFISIDQNIPDINGEIVAADNGLNLCEEIVKQNLLIYRIIYTAYGKPAYGHRVGKLDDTPYFEKGPPDPQAGVYNAHGWAALIKIPFAAEDDPLADRVYNAHGWAALIKSTLENGYIPFALKQAGRFLPLSMAERARRALIDYQAKAYEPYLRLWLEIWESTLQLAYAQTLALCFHAKISLRTTPDGKLANQEQILRMAWPQLARKRWLSPWLRYLGRGEDGAGEPFLQGASKPLRALRNDLSHSFSKDNWGALTEQHHDPLLLLIDALAFWIENPLLTRLQFHPMKRQWLTAQALMGDQLPFSIREIEASSMTEGEIAADSVDHVWLPWPQGDDGTHFLDLDPFIVLERDEQGYPHIRLLSHRARQPGQWLYRSLRDGRLQSRALSSTAQQAVQAVFG